MKEYQNFAALSGQTWSLHPQSQISTRQQAIRDLVEEGFPYSRKLSGHSSCVNAITFSNGDGRLLASAGDDPFIQLWDFYQDELTGPSYHLIGHNANIFSLAFSCSNQFLYSGDTDAKIRKYDVSRWTTHSATPGRPLATLERHRDSIRALSCHPENDEIVLSASDDGIVYLHDFRVGNGPRAQGHLYGGPSFTGVQYHPVMPHLFVTGDALGGVCLRDSRMAMDSYTIHKQGIINEYVTSLAKYPHNHLTRPEIGSITFDKTGEKLAVTMLHYLPTIYALLDPFPIATCSGRNLPDGTPVPAGERTYSNSCTIKHGSFGGPSLDVDEYYSAGSDDFRAYVWKIPSIESLTAARIEVKVEDWDAGAMPDSVGFANQYSAPRRIPVELSTPICRLGGHRSIINSTLMHPHWPLLLTAGVERHITLHSPLPSSPCASGMSKTPTEVRRLPEGTPEDTRRFFRAFMGGRMNEDDDDQETIALFDEILRQEGGADVFSIRRWDPDSESDEEADEAADNGARMDVDD
ncbi:WD40 repeat-like protein [Panus rudis PR-1116 ss-1]|nr:WD40 repeat-like protein [Panus rudis PR-1116 ss-1]